MVTSSQSVSLSPDWVVSSTSSHNACRDRGWFSEYTPFESEATDFTSISKFHVAGVGTVELPTKRYPNGSGSRNHDVLRLTNVLHIPTIIFNIIGLRPLSYNYNTRLGGSGPATDGWINDMTGRRIAYFDPSKPLFTVKLSGPPVGPRVGPSNMEHGSAYVLSCQWPKSEQQRWASFLAGQVATAPYIEAEKQFLKSCWDSEYKFLQTHDLSIYKDEDREEGRRILRAIMQRNEVNGVEDDEHHEHHEDEDDNEKLL